MSNMCHEFSNTSRMFPWCFQHAHEANNLLCFFCMRMVSLTYPWCFPTCSDLSKHFQICQNMFRFVLTCSAFPNMFIFYRAPWGLIYIGPTYGPIWVLCGPLGPCTIRAYPYIYIYIYLCIGTKGPQGPIWALAKALYRTLLWALCSLYGLPYFPAVGRPWHSGPNLWPSPSSRKRGLITNFDDWARRADRGGY